MVWNSVSNILYDLLRRSLANTTSLNQFQIDSQHYHYQFSLCISALRVYGLFSLSWCTAAEKAMNVNHSLLQEEQSVVDALHSLMATE